MSGGDVSIIFVRGTVAPMHEAGVVELDLEGITLTEQGTDSGLPLIDIHMSGPADERYVVTVTGRVVTMLSAAVKGVNKRIHGKEEP